VKHGKILALDLMEAQLIGRRIGLMRFKIQIDLHALALVLERIFVESHPGSENTFFNLGFFFFHGPDREKFLWPADFAKSEFLFDDHHFPGQFRRYTGIQ